MPSLIQRVRESWACHKAKRECIRLHPTCALCGSKRSFLRIAIEAHHRVPVHVMPSLAAEPANLLSLCKSCHFYAGHCGNWKAWNSNLDETILAIKQVMNEIAQRQR